MTIIKIKNVDVETIQKGKNSYQVAEVLYDQGEYKNKTFKVMSFVNPAVFKAVSEYEKGGLYNVDITKNDKGFNQWNSIKPSDGSVDDNVPASGPSRSAGPTVNSTGNRSFETAEERASRQRLIVRQSSLSNAIEYHSAHDIGSVEEILETADKFTKWVFEEVDLFDQPNDLDE